MVVESLHELHLFAFLVREAHPIHRNIGGPNNPMLRSLVYAPHMDHLLDDCTPPYAARSLHQDQ